MAASEKVLRLAAAVKENILFRGAGLTGAVTCPAVASEGPDVFAVAVGGTNFGIVKFTQWTATTPGGLDGIGLTQRVYSPHIAQFLFDSDKFATDYDVFARVMFELAKLGVKIEVYANATVAMNQITSGNLKATYDDIMYPLTSTN